jgi:ribonuclease D
VSRWIATDDDLAAVCRSLVEADVYALDTEFHRERTYYARLALIQIAWEGDLVLVDPLAVDPAPLAEVLAGPGLMVAHAADQDLEILERACGTGPSRLVDTQVAAGFLGWSTPSLQSLLKAVLDVDMVKGDRMTDWMKRPLSDGQTAYAAADVAHLVALWRSLESDLAARGRLDWALDESRQLLERSRAQSDPARAWWRIKETRNMRGRSRGVAQAVAEWRELRARRVDLPVRFVLSDMALAGIVHRQPARESDLREIRGLDARSLKGEAAAEIIAAVRRGRDMPDEELQVPPVDDTDRSLRPAITLVAAWLGQLAKDLEIDAAMLATRADVNALVQGDGRGRLTEGWRRQLVAEPVADLVEGRAALAFEGQGRLVLEARSGQPLGGRLEQ